MRLKKIRDLAGRKGISIGDLAKAINMTPQNLYKCMRDNRIMANDLENVSKVFGVKVSYFFDEEADEKDYKISELNLNIVDESKDSFKSEKYIKKLEKKIEELKDERNELKSEIIEQNKKIIGLLEVKEKLKNDISKGQVISEEEAKNI